MKKWKNKRYARDNFLYGQKAEAIFKSMFPHAKKQNRGADFELNGLQVEIGRSRVLEMRLTVFYRKIFYNVLPEHHEELKQVNPHKCLEYVIDNPEILKVPMEDFKFVYFTNSLSKVAFFTFYDLLVSQLLTTNKGEYYFKLRLPQLYDLTDLYELLPTISKEENMFTKDDLGFVSNCRG